MLPAFCLSACAPTTQESRSASPPTAPACFNVAMIQGYTPTGQHTVRFDLGPGPAYEVDFSGPQCDSIDWTHQIAVDTQAGSLICTGNEAAQGNIIFRDPIVPHGTICHIDAVRVAG
jgi:hypothetical protein